MERRKYYLVKKSVVVEYDDTYASEGRYALEHFDDSPDVRQRHQYKMSPRRDLSAPNVSSSDRQRAKDSFSRPAASATAGCEGRYEVLHLDDLPHVRQRHQYEMSPRRDLSAPNASYCDRQRTEDSLSRPAASASGRCDGRYEVQHFDDLLHVRQRHQYKMSPRRDVSPPNAYYSDRQRTEDSYSRPTATAAAGSDGSLIVQDFHKLPEGRRHQNRGSPGRDVTPPRYLSHSDQQKADDIYIRPADKAKSGSETRYVVQHLDLPHVRQNHQYKMSPRKDLSAPNVSSSDRQRPKDSFSRPAASASGGCDGRYEVQHFDDLLHVRQRHQYKMSPRRDVSSPNAYYSDRQRTEDSYSRPTATAAAGSDGSLIVQDFHELPEGRRHQNRGSPGRDVTPPRYLSHSDQQKADDIYIRPADKATSGSETRYVVQHLDLPDLPDVRQRHQYKMSPRRDVSPPNAYYSDRQRNEDSYSRPTATAAAGSEEEHTVHHLDDVPHERQRHHFEVSPCRNSITPQTSHFDRHRTGDVYPRPSATAAAGSERRYGLDNFYELPDGPQRHQLKRPPSANVSSARPDELPLVGSRGPFLALPWKEEASVQESKAVSEPELPRVSGRLQQRRRLRAQPQPESENSDIDDPLPKTSKKATSSRVDDTKTLSEIAELLANPSTSKRKVAAPAKKAGKRTGASTRTKVKQSIESEEELEETLNTQDDQLDGPKFSDHVIVISDGEQDAGDMIYQNEDASLSPYNGDYEGREQPKCDYDCVICFATWKPGDYKGILLNCKCSNFCFHCAVDIFEKGFRCPLDRKEIIKVESALVEAPTS